MVQIPRPITLPYKMTSGQSAEHLAMALNENFKILCEEHNKLVGALSLFFPESPCIRPKI